MIPEKGWKFASTNDENPWVEDENLSIQGIGFLETLSIIFV